MISHEIHKMVFSLIATDNKKSRRYGGTALVTAAKSRVNFYHLKGMRRRFAVGLLL